jgi:hypothetical protein
LNRCLDEAIAQAVTEYGRRASNRWQTRNQRMGFLAHELRNRLNTAMLSFGVLKGGTVPINGSTGTP